MEEWISQREYCKRFKVNPDTVKKMIHEGKLEAIKTQGGQYKIRLHGDVVPRDVYEKEKELRIKAEAKLEHIAQLAKLH